MNGPFEALSLAELRCRTSVKWQLYGPDVLPMWVAEMDVLPVPAVSRTLRAALDRGDTGYPFGQQYQRAFADFAARHWQWRPDTTHAIVVADVMTGIRESLLATTDSTSAVIIPTPVYPPFLGFSSQIGRRVVEVALAPAADGSARLDLDGLAAAMTSNAGTGAALLLCSPHNPTGTVHSAAELGAIARQAAATQTTVIVDEIHAPLSLGPDPFVPYLSLPGTDSAIVITSASKAFNLAGLKAAMVLPGPGALESVRRFGEHVKYGASHFGVLSHVAALDEGDDWLAAVNGNISANRDLLAQLLQAEQLPLRATPGTATYLCWVDASGAGLGADPANAFLRIGRVAFNSGTHFGAAGTAHVRMNVATRQDLIREGVLRMARTIEQAANSSGHLHPPPP